MAKDKKEEKKGVQTPEITEENVMDQIRKGNLIDEEVIKLGDEEDNKEEQERKVREYRRAKNKAKYLNLKALLQLRARRREERATKQWLNDTKAEFEKLKTGELTPLEYEEARKEAYKKLQDAMSQSSKDLEKEVRELQKQFPNYWSYDWDRY